MNRIMPVLLGVVLAALTSVAPAGDPAMSPASPHPPTDTGGSPDSPNQPADNGRSPDALIKILDLGLARLEERDPDPGGNI